MELVANFILNNESLDAQFDVSEVNFDVLFEIYASGTTWGNISGNIENQTDLQNALNSLNTAIENEATTRANNDTLLQEGINTLNSDLTAEKTQRESSDETLQGNINTLSNTVNENYATLDNKITTNTNSITAINSTIEGYGDIVTYDAADFATSAQGSLADTALQPGDNISELINDTGYITGIDSTDVTNALGYIPYDSSNPDGYITAASLPTVNNGTLTIQQNNNTVGTFTANQAGNTTANITVPTQASDIDAVPTSRTINGKALSANITLNSSDVGALPNTTTINDLTTQAQQDALNSGATTTNIGQITTNQNNIEDIQDLIPTQASTSNQLADKSFVNSSVSTNTAYFIGTFNSVAELEAYSGTVTNNDYAFVVTTDSAGNTLYDRYKYNADTQEWLFEYELNNSSFTANQWAAINSGITTTDVAQIATNTADIATKQDIINDLATIRSGAALGATSLQPEDISVSNSAITLNGTSYSTTNVYQAVTTSDGEYPILTSSSTTTTSGVKNTAFDTGVKINHSLGRITCNDLVVNNTNILDELNNKQVFVVEYNVTTFAEIQTAISQNKLPLFTYNNKQYIYSNYNSAAGDIYFVNLDNIPNVSYTRVDANSWRSISSYRLETYANKTQSLSDTSTTTQYPSAKAVVDYVTDNKQVFLATYGSTTRQEIVDALAANKIVMMIENNIVYHLSMLASSYFYFTCLNNAASNTIVFNGSTWSKATYSLQRADLKVTSLSSSSTDAQFPSAKCVYDEIQNVTAAIPTVGDGTITINQGGTQKGTFTVNQSGNTTIDLDAGGGSSRNIGEIVSSTIPLTDAGLHLLDGALIDGSGIYSAFVDYIANLDLTANYFCTEAEWQQSVTDYGVCGKFVYDSVNNTVRLPKITGVVEGTTDVNALGDLLEAGLPNITGYLTHELRGSSNWETTETNGSGALNGYKTSTYSLGDASSGMSGNIITFDASRSSSIYGNSITVQPQTIKVLYYIVIATSTKTDIEVDIDEIATDLNGKADVDLSNVPTSKGILEESYVSGTSWYRVYSDGWCEQGGVVPASTSTVNYLKSYTDTNYSILMQYVNISNSSTTYYIHYCAPVKYTDHFTIVSGSYQRQWFACGYIR